MARINESLDKKIPLPKPSAAEIRLNDAADRIETGKQLLGTFFADGRIRGVAPEGHVFEHAICESLSHKFLQGLAAIDMRGSR